MPDIIISFDSEDYLTPAAADAELWWAQALSQRGIRGCFQLVGEFVRSLTGTFIIGFSNPIFCSHIGSFKSIALVKRKITYKFI